MASPSTSRYSLRCPRPLTSLAMGSAAGAFSRSVRLKSFHILSREMGREDFRAKAILSHPQTEHLKAAPFQRFRGIFPSASVLSFIIPPPFRRAENRAQYVRAVPASGPDGPLRFHPSFHCREYIIANAPRNLRHGALLKNKEL